MFTVLVWVCNWILFMHGWFCPLHLIHLIGRKPLHFEKSYTVLFGLPGMWIYFLDCCVGNLSHIFCIYNLFSGVFHNIGNSVGMWKTWAPKRLRFGKSETACIHATKNSGNWAKFFPHRWKQFSLQQISICLQDFYWQLIFMLTSHWWNRFH